MQKKTPIWPLYVADALMFLTVLAACIPNIRLYEPLGVWQTAILAGIVFVSMLLVLTPYVLNSIAEVKTAKINMAKSKIQSDEQLRTIFGDLRTLRNSIIEQMENTQKAKNLADSTAQELLGEKLRIKKLGDSVERLAQKSEADEEAFGGLKLAFGEFKSELAAAKSGGELEPRIAKLESDSAKLSGDFEEIKIKIEELIGEIQSALAGGGTEEAELKAGEESEGEEADEQFEAADNGAEFGEADESETYDGDSGKADKADFEERAEVEKGEDELNESAEQDEPEELESKNFENSRKEKKLEDSAEDGDDELKPEDKAESGAEASKKVKEDTAKPQDEESEGKINGEGEAGGAKPEGEADENKDAEAEEIAKHDAENGISDTEVEEPIKKPKSHPNWAGMIDKALSNSQAFSTRSVVSRFIEKNKIGEAPDLSDETEAPLAEKLGEPDVSESESVEEIEGSEEYKDLEKEEKKNPQAALFDDLEIPEIKKAKPARSGDTAIVANAFLGIGNRPFVRGSSAGLSPDKGVAMQMLEIGKWQWICEALPTDPIKITIWLNDEKPSTLGEIVLNPGETLDIDLSF